MTALIINASILILAAATFHKTGNAQVVELEGAHAMLAPLVGSLLAPKLFAIALLCCGLNSTITATLAGQIVMEGFLDLRIPAWLRRLTTRMVAIVPAALVTLYYGSEGTGKLLILSQVILAFQLPFAVVPLVAFTQNRAKLAVDPCLGYCFGHYFSEYQTLVGFGRGLGQVTCGEHDFPLKPCHA
jgi:manganese transport protein